MSVTLEHVDKARWDTDEQVRLDLVRIYEDAPKERVPTQAVLPFIEQHLEAGHFFACAHFNDHLLGAAAIQEAPDRAWWLSELCVRKTTRRRGVGSRLAALLGEQALQEGRKLRIETASLPLADQLLLSKLGYRPGSQAERPALGGPLISDFVELDPQGKG
ncbi:acetyltransferase (GNAT) family protein [Vreelandella songnenensis]|uniref:Acetyltransferase (GNAT) family protein n=1 Tax=Vreelandella songnenensis TaxID=1176243 RepID=A0A2T0V9W3_9GAMM|nr:acetyl-CoA sensor PanZ family protein [Halomonas songnenensis]PRY66907.1 acetyltransferase (GNAT) family protein [Halomonas songnenensis]